LSNNKGWARRYLSTNAKRIATLMCKEWQHQHKNNDITNVKRVAAPCRKNGSTNTITTVAPT
jgi:hypothetical protein